MARDKWTLRCFSAPKPKGEYLFSVIFESFSSSSSTFVLGCFFGWLVQATNDLKLRNPPSQDQGQSGHPCDPGQRSWLDHRHPTKNRTRRNFRGCATASPISESQCNHDRDATE